MSRELGAACRCRYVHVGRLNMAGMGCNAHKAGLAHAQQPLTCLVCGKKSGFSPASYRACCSRLRSSNFKTPGVYLRQRPARNSSASLHPAQL